MQDPTPLKLAGEQESKIIAAATAWGNVHRKLREEILYSMQHSVIRGTLLEQMGNTTEADTMLLKALGMNEGLEGLE